MANYLGKISALVTANTRDFDQKLNASAKEVGRFAGSISRDLSSASSRAAKSLSGIYTQAQKVERALQAATSGRLDFKGVREFIDNLRSADNSVQSLEKSVRRLSSGQQAELLSRSSFASIDEFIAKFRQAGQLKNALDDQKVRVALEFIGVEEARRKLQQLASVDFEISGPLQRAVVEVQKFPAAIQRSLNPALTEAQLLVQGLENEIRDGAVISEQAFDRAAKSVEKFNAVVARASEARRLVGGLQTGNEIAFANPNFVQAQKESAEAQRRAAALSATQLKENPQVRELVSQISEVSQEAERLRAKYDQLSSAGSASAASVGSSLDGQIRKQRELNSLLEREVTLLESGAEKTGNFVSFTGDATGEFGPKPLFSNRDPSGRPLQERFAEQQAIKNSRELDQQVEDEISEALERQNQAAEKRLEIANAMVAVLQRESDLISQSAAKDVDRAEVLERRRVRSGESTKGLSRDEFSFDLDSSELTKYQNQVERLKLAIADLAEDETKDAEFAIRRFGTEASLAFSNATIRTQQGKEALEDYANEAINAAAAARKIDPSQLAAGVKRVGDVGRRGFDKLSLGINQAAFAIDDFFSATGGIEFKLRAVQNNLTQLGFILGETKGLFIALGAAVGANLVISTLKYNSLLEDESVKVDALNGMMREQKSAVDSLAASYDNLTKSIQNSGLGEREQIQQGRRGEIRRIRDEERRLRLDLRAGIDPEVIRLRTRQADIEKRIAESPNIGERAGLQAELLGLRPQLASAEDRARRSLGSGKSPLDILLDAASRRATAEAQAADRRAQANGAAPGDPIAAADAERSRREREIRGLDLSTRKAAEEAINKEIFDLSRRIREESGFFGDPILVSELESQVQALIQDLADVADAEVSEAFIGLATAAFGVADTLDAAQRELESSGITGGFLSDQLTRISELQGQLSERAAAARRAGNLELLQGLELSIQGLQEWASEIAAAASAASIFSGTLKRVATDLANTVAGEAKSAAESARRQANAASTNPLASPEDRRIAQRRRIEAEQQASRASRAVQRLEEDRIAAVQQFERDAAAGNLGNEVQALIDERRRLREEAAAEGTTIERRQQIEARQRQIDAELSSRFERSDRGRELRRRADRLDASSTQERARLDSAARGEDLIQSSADQAARQLAQSLLDIREAFDLRRREGLADNANEQAQAEQRLRDDTFRQVAPAIFALADQSANAVLQGPSRARLAASDITTQSGTDELNRLLRGDDSARQQNLVELRKQTQELEKVNTNLRALGVA